MNAVLIVFLAAVLALVAVPLLAPGLLIGPRPRHTHRAVAARRARARVRVQFGKQRTPLPHATRVRTPRRSW